MKNSALSLWSIIPCTCAMHVQSTGTQYSYNIAWICQTVDHQLVFLDRKHFHW